MASFVSMCCSFTYPKTLIINKDLISRRTDSCRLLVRSSTGLTRIHFLASKSCGEELVSIMRRDNPAVAVFLNCKVVCCAPRVISGFWVGPDIEDGWGFIEATVNQLCDT
nr:hypothetical protein [Tanacetum cinerariifolium]